jgi:hypothetical protein
MIVYDLLCNCGFRFEGWFKNRTDYSCQQENNLIACPMCGGNDIAKLLSPVSLQRKGRPGAENPESQITAAEISQQLVKGIQEYVKKNFENVGSQFANEALKIHYGAGEKRNIRGVATADEEKMLVKEGVEIVKLPLPDDDGKEPVN